MLMDLGWDEHACPPVKWEAWEKWRVKSLLRQTYCSATCCVTFSHSFSTKLTWQDTWRCCLRQKENRNDAQSAPAEGQQSSAAAYSNNSVVCDWCFCIFFFLLSNKYCMSLSTASLFALKNITQEQALSFYPFLFTLMFVSVEEKRLVTVPAVIIL